MPLYGRKARFTDDIVLNNQGLQGNGQLEYLTTTLRSKALVFTPDSTLGRADTLSNLAATSPTPVPQVEAGDVFVRLEPAGDVLRTEKLRKPLVMFNGQAELHGLTELTPTGMTGAGLADFRNATLESEFFEFATLRVHADTSDFRLTEGDINSIAFKTDNVNATIKLDERVGEFVSNGTETRVEFPVNKYICFMDRFKWYMDQGDIELESDRTAAAGSEDLQLSGSNFISIRPEQDSLSFMAPKARYDLKKHLITANEVQYIQVADALIAPDSMRVRIRRNAAMDPLVNAVITANFVTRHHRIYNATANIQSRRQYSGKGELDYVDEDGKSFPIHLHNINVDTTYQTYALGRIAREQDFRLSPAFDFFGEVKLTASSKLLTFTGSTRIQHGCSDLARNWMGFRGEVDPMEVFIPVADTLIDEEGARIGAGIYLTDEDPFRSYGTFLSRMENDNDRTIIAAKGLLYYDKGRKEYVISNKDKIRQRNLPGDLVSVNVDDCIISGDGRINSGMDLGRVTLQDIGTLTHDAAAGKTEAQVVMLADFHFHDNAQLHAVDIARHTLKIADRQEQEIARH